jgi:hypothetical protein
VLNNTTLLQASESSWSRPLNTVTLNTQLAVLPEGSVAVHVTVVSPTAKQLPDAGVQTMLAEQLSVAVGAKVTVLHGSPTVLVTAVMSAGQTILGDSTSLTATANEQLVPDAVLQVTVVVPTGKNDPEGGLHVTAPQAVPATGPGYTMTVPHWPVVFEAVMFAGHVITQQQM